MLFSAYMEEAGFQKIDFMAWAKFGLPILALSLPLTWLYLSRWLFPMGHMQLEGGREYLQTELQKLGPMSRGEKLTALVFILAALGWALSPLFEKMFPGFEIEDSTIAIAATISFFIIPVSLPRREFLLDWEWSAKIPWEVLVQFGGGLSLAAAVSSSGLAKEIGHSLQGLAGAPLLVMIGAIVVTIIALSEVASNTATAATLLPIIGSLAVALEYDPLLLTAPAAIAASCGFMLPIATPPNAIVFAGHHLEVSEMVKAGFILDIIAAVLVTVVPYFIIQWF